MADEQLVECGENMSMEARAAKRRRRGSGFLMEQERREGKGIEQQGSVQYGRVQGGTDHTGNMHAAILLCRCCLGQAEMRILML